jgi:hypothetical protein
VWQLFYEVIMNTKLAKVANCSYVQSGLGSSEPLVTFLSVDQYVTLFYVGFSIMTSHLTYTIDSLALNSWPAVL